MTLRILSTSPLATEGDENPETILVEVGRVLSRWERIELELSFLYGQLLFRPDDIEAWRLYGAGRIFSDRMEGFQRVADQFFCKMPNQEHEGRLRRLCLEVRAGAQRRNDIAHGIVRGIEFTFSNRTDYFLFPTYYDPRRFNIEGGPIYAYSSVDLTDLAWSLRSRAEDLVRMRNILRRACAKKT